MKTTDTIENQANEQTLTHRCVQSCKALLAGIEQTKNRLAVEFEETLETHSHLFQLALNEAEALAWQTAYPHLFFPSLATEKVQAVAAWRTRQQSLHRGRLAFAEAA